MSLIGDLWLAGLVQEAARNGSRQQSAPAPVVVVRPAPRQRPRRRIAGERRRA